MGEQRLLDWSFETTGLKQLDASDSSAAGGRREACTATCRGTARRRRSLIYSRIMEISLFIYQLVSCNPFLQSNAPIISMQNGKGRMFLAGNLPN